MTVLGIGAVKTDNDDQGMLFDTKGAGIEAPAGKSFPGPTNGKTRS
jgi:hypothetical protein